MRRALCEGAAFSRRMGTDIPHMRRQAREPYPDSTFHVPRYAEDVALSRSTLTRRTLLIAASSAASALLAACRQQAVHAVVPPSRTQESSAILPLVASATPTGDPVRTEEFGMVGVFDVDWLADPTFARFLDNLAASPGAFTAVRFFGALNSGTQEKTTPGEDAKSDQTVQRDASAQRFAPAFAGLEALTTRGLIPFVQLSFFPTEISPAPTLPPASFADWELLVRDFLDALAADPRFGLDLIRTWWFEVWNEPNIPVFWQGTFDQYLALYRATSDAVRASGYPIRLGGPALAWLPTADPAAGAPLMRRFLQFLHDTPDVRCDFLSFHEKGTWIGPAQGAAEPALSDLITAAEETARMALAICPERCANLPIINNEADMKVGFDIPYEPRMNERFAAWLSSTLVAYDDLSVRYREHGLRFHAAADDANLQLVQAPFDGRRAIMTRAAPTATGDLFKVPVYHFYELLRLLGDRHGTVIAGGETCYPSTDLFHLLAVAADRIGALFAVYPADLNVAQPRTVAYTITDIPWPTVNIARFQIDATLSNAYTAAGARLALLPPDPATARAIRQAQELALFAPIQRNVTLVNGRFQDQFTIAPFTTLLYWITPFLPTVPAMPRWATATIEDGNCILRWESSRAPWFFSYEVYAMNDREMGALLSPVPLRSALWVDTAPSPDPRRYAIRVISASGVASPMVKVSA